tara:strand:- start:1523 stop:2563 length:1041 start_codon:yes stop_codon:yes gene_type:complete
MSKVLKVENGNYSIKVESGGNIILDTARGATSGSPPQPAGTVIVRGSLEVEGTTTTLESKNTVITDNVIVLNNGESGAGISITNNQEAGIQIDRGTLDDAKFVFDETISWTLGGDSGTGTFKLIDSTSQILPLRTDGIKADGNLYLDTGAGVISVTNTVDYEEKVFTYTGGVIVDGGGGVVVDDDNIPNAKAIVDYFTYALTSVGVADIIRENDTKVEVSDFQTTGAPSNAVIAIDGTDKLVVYGDRMEFDSLRIESSKISTLDSNQNLVLEAPGIGSVQVNDNLFITETPGPDDALTDPAAPLEGIKLYSKTQATGNTGLFFVNKSSTRDEIISNNRALVYSMVF